MRKIIRIIVILMIPFAVQAQLQLQNGIQWKATGDVTLVVTDLPAIGTGESVQFEQSNLTVRGDITLKGVTAWTLDQLVLDGNLKLETPLHINEKLVLHKGILDLYNQGIVLSEHATITGESELNRIVGTANGYIQITLPLFAPTQTNPGNLGAVITSTANLGLTTIKRSHNTVAGMVKRFYEMAPANNTALNASLQFHYLDAELNELPEKALAIMMNTGAWNYLGKTQQDTVANYVTISGVSSLHHYALGMAEALPLKWGKVTVRCKDDGALLQWQTLEEQHTSHFVVQRSMDGIQWSDAGMIPATGRAAHYQFQDKPAYKFYRSLSIDADGHKDYSIIVTLHPCTVTPGIKLWPNPATTTLHVSVPAPVSTRVISADGKVWQQNKLTNNSEVLDISSLPAGAYFLEITGSSKQVIPFLKDH